MRLLRLPTRASLAAAHERTPDGFRLLTVVSLHADAQLDHAIGWGECSALNQAGYTHESSESAFELLRTGVAFAADMHPMAAAAVDMAVLDATLRHDGMSLASYLGTADCVVAAGAVVGLGPIPTMLDAIERLEHSGFGRIKVKVTPDRLLSPLQTIREVFPSIELQVDANGSLGPSEIPTLLRLQELGVTAIEQPFEPGDRASATRLVTEAEIDVVADEAVTNAADVAALATDRAATAVAIKTAEARRAASDAGCRGGGRALRTQGVNWGNARKRARPSPAGSGGGPSGLQNCRGPLTRTTVVA